jgi:hypothetical protein
MSVRNREFNPSCFFRTGCLRIAVFTIELLISWIFFVKCYAHHVYNPGHREQKVAGKGCLPFAKNFQSNFVGKGISSMLIKSSMEMKMVVEFRGHAVSRPVDESKPNCPSLQTGY